MLVGDRAGTLWNPTRATGEEGLSEQEPKWMSLSNDEAVSPN